MSKAWIKTIFVKVYGNYYDLYEDYGDDDVIKLHAQFTFTTIFFSIVNFGTQTRHLRGAATEVCHSVFSKSIVLAPRTNH